MAGKRAPGGGRKPLGEFRKTGTLTTRITDAVRSGLAREAARNGRSLSHEVQMRLVESLQAPRKIKSEWGPPHIWSLTQLVSRVARAVEEQTQERWHEDRFTADNVRAGVETLVMHLAPKESAQTPQHVVRRAKELEERLPDHPEFADNWRKAGGIGHSVALGVISALSLHHDYPPINHPSNEYFSDDFHRMPTILKNLAPKKRNTRH